jgi:hypothetical protein
MAMRPLTLAERDGMVDRLGPDAIARLDSLICAGYVLHALGCERPEDEDVDRVIALADYIRTGDA